ncbi:MAG: M48 family metallopeptidase [Gammaproteobacteria bacterium]
MQLFTVLFILALALSTGVSLWLAQRQIGHVKTRRGSVPEEFSERISLQAHQRAADYTVARVGFGRITLLWTLVVTLAWTLGGGLQLLDDAVRSFELSPVLTGTAVLVAFVIIGGLIELPFEYWQTFRIEQRFGFNRSTVGLFFLDKIKGTLVALVLGLPLAWIVVYLMESAGSLWWLWVWAVWFGFSLFLSWAWPAFIAPLFNTFSPLSDESLKTRIDALLERCGFRSQGVFIMDGSRRSAHGNAYFTGFGRNKRIVFFDTLLEGLTAREVEAVLAHELGHFRLKHIRNRLAVMAALSLAALALLGWLAQQPWFYTALGLERASSHGALLLFMLAGPAFGFFLSPLMAAYSRRHEFQADDFAARQTEAEALVDALVKLYEENANTLTPDPMYSAFNDSHPPAPIRIAHLRGSPA